MSAPELLVISEDCGLGCDSKLSSTDALPSPVPSAPQGHQGFAPTTPPRAPPCAVGSAADAFSTQSKDDETFEGHENPCSDHSGSAGSRTSSGNSDALNNGSSDECAMFDPPSPTSQSQSREIVFDLDDAAFCSDYFRMYEFKVRSTAFLRLFATHAHNPNPTVWDAPCPSYSLRHPSRTHRQ